MKIHIIEGSDSEVPVFLEVVSDTEPTGFVGVFLGSHISFEITDHEYSELLEGRTKLPSPLVLGKQIDAKTFYKMIGL